MSEVHYLVNPCMITFDDGMYNFFKHGYPILRKHQVPILLFIPAQAILQGSIWPLKYFQELQMGDLKYIDLNKSTQATIMKMVAETEPLDDYRLLDWQELQQLDASFVSIQSHGGLHQYLSCCEDVDLIEELKLSKELIESKLKRNVEMIAYPFGDYNEAVLQESTKHYKCGFIVGDQLARLADINDCIKNHRFHIHNGSIYELYARISGFIPFLKKLVGCFS